MITNSGDTAVLSLWEIYDFVEAESQEGHIQLHPLTPSVVNYAPLSDSDTISLDYNKRLHYLTDDLIPNYLVNNFRNNN